jgi:hypothetical protein
MPIAKTRTTSNQKSHWASVSDDRLIDLDLEIDDPEAVGGLVLEVPVNYLDAHVEYKYDHRGEDVERYTCVHGHHKHKAGFVMNVDGTRFMVGHICAKSIYDEDFDQYTADFDAAVTRRDALRRVREIRDAVTPFVAWLDTIASSDVCKQFSRLRGQLDHQMGWVYDSLPALAELDPRITKAELPKYLCAEKTDIKLDFEKLMNETAGIQILLVGEAEKIAGAIGALRARLDGLARRAEQFIDKLKDVERFFQPASLETICSYANTEDNPKRRRYQAGMLSIAVRGIDKCIIECPKGYAVPSQLPIDAPRTALTRTV